jgi:hypothetical protein
MQCKQQLHLGSTLVSGVARKNMKGQRRGASAQQGTIITYRTQLNFSVACPCSPRVSARITARAPTCSTDGTTVLILTADRGAVKPSPPSTLGVEPHPTPAVSDATRSYLHLVKREARRAANSRMVPGRQAQLTTYNGQAAERLVVLKRRIGERAAGVTPWPSVKEERSGKR